MKKLSTLLFFLLLNISMFATYYVAGNGVAGISWCDGKNWDPKGSPMDENNSITFKNVPAGSYLFKVTTGSWSTSYGYSDLSDFCSNLSTFAGSDNNIAFTSTVMHNITITIDGSTKKICLTGDGKEAEIDSTTIAAVGVPAEYEGVLLQAFYWDSYKKTTYGGRSTKWVNLILDSTDIAHDFDLIWLPPASNGGGVGYYPKCYSSFSSDHGNYAGLTALIAAMHRNGTKVIADMVLNHHQSSSGWAKGFMTDNFGSYGSFQITSEHICAGDEAFTSSSSDSKSLPHGADDTGTNDGGCRDLDHSSPYVQDLCKAYAKFMLDSIGFDGFRYDMVIGYGGNFLCEYNLHAKPFFSVSEYWSDLGSTIGYLRTTKYNTMVFDFPLKYAIKSAINSASYSGLTSASNSLRGKGLSKYAVTFVDNHDTFGRDNTDYLVKDFTVTNAKPKVMQANAFILSMPGVPCVFYPHWKTCQKEISHLIRLRKAAGIHSESLVTDETAGSRKYSATVHGHNGQLILRMGANRDMECPAGFVHLYQGVDTDIYLSEDCADGIDLLLGINDVSINDNDHPSAHATKRLINGQLIITVAGQSYDVMGKSYDVMETVVK